MARNDEATTRELTLDRVVSAFKALGHPARLRTLAMLRDGELCVCQLTAVLGLAISTVSGHLAELRRAGLVQEEKEGRWVRYRLRLDEGGPVRLLSILEMLEGDPAVHDDRELAAELRRRSPEALCEAGLDLAALCLADGRDGDPRENAP